MFNQNIFGGGGGTSSSQQPTANPDDVTLRVAFGQTPVFGSTVFGSPPLTATGSIFTGNTAASPPPYPGTDPAPPQPPPYSQHSQDETRTTSTTGWGFGAAAANPPAFVFGIPSSTAAATSPIFPGAAFRDTPSSNLFGDRFGGAPKVGASIFGSHQATSTSSIQPPTTFSFVQPPSVVSPLVVTSAPSRGVRQGQPQSSYERNRAAAEHRLQQMEEAERRQQFGEQRQPLSLVPHGGERGVVSSVSSAAAGRGVRSALTVADKKDPQQQLQQSRVTGLFGRAVRGALPVAQSSSSPYKYDRPRDPRVRRVSERDEAGQSVTRLPPEQIEQLTSIVCKGIPPSLNSRPNLLRHFGRFGVVRKVVCNVAKNSATVHFSNHAGAVVAKTSGSILQPGAEPMLILWSRVVPASGRTKSTSEDAVSSSSGSTTIGRSRSSVPRISGDGGTGGSHAAASSAAGARSPSRKIYVDDGELGDELSAMSQEPAQMLERPPTDSPNKGKAVLSAIPAVKSKVVKGKATNRSDASSTIDVPDSLPAILSISAHSSNERYRVLEARDKVLRTGVRKQSNIATAKATVGTCPDMCPEKERYQREDRKQLHPFELRDTGDVDHRRAVKEYSRSSADQEEPLPSELRPPQTLVLTMEYLVCNIMDRHLEGLSTAEEWYDFLWNRTRAIRKDITQQHLCDASSVRLVEQCARFHIHAASQLCEEDMIAFDQKINNENLTNCLQTLKHFYEDLAKSNQSQSCPREAEFRAYDVLLNLNEGGDTLRQAQQFPPHIRTAPELSEALEVLAAINSNNYVRFFRLVRCTSYLNACLLQRYFGQVRQKALVAIMRAYCPSTRPGLFPANKLVDLLAFEDLDDARLFVEAHGLTIENGHLGLDRSQFYHPDAALPLRRAHRVIESKRGCSVGEVIYGGPLPVNPLEWYTPHNSFDAHGRLIDRDPREPYASAQPATATSTWEMPSSFAVQRQQQMSVEGAPPSYLASSAIATPATAGEVFLMQGLPDVLNNVLEEIIGEVAVERARIVSFDVMRLLKQTTMEIATVVLNEVCNDMIRQAIDQTIRLAKAAELQLRREREQHELERRQQHDLHVRQLKETYSEHLVEALLDDIVLDLSTRLAVEEIKEAKAVAKKQCMERCCRDAAQELCESCVLHMVEEVCHTMHQEQTEFKRRVLSRVSANLDLWRAAVFVRKWRRVTAKRVAARCSMERFPASSLCRLPGTLEQRLKSGGRLASPLVAADNRARVAILLELSERSAQIREHLGGHAFIDVVQIARDHVPYCRRLGCGIPDGVTPRNLYWKLLFSTASHVNGDVNRQLLDWLKFKLTPRLPIYESSITVKGEGFCLIASDLNRLHTYDTSVCVRAIVGRKHSGDVSSASTFLGAQGVMFLICTPDHERYDDLAYQQRFWDEECNRLHDLLSSKPVSPALPLAIVVVVSNTKPSNLDDSCWGGTVQQQLRLDLLQDTGLVSEVSVLVFGAGLQEPEATTGLLHATQWLARRCPDPPSLVSRDLQLVASDTLARYFSPLIYRDLARCDANSLQHLPANVLIDEYNNCIKYVANLVLDTPENLSWPAPEFLEKAFDLPPLNWSASRSKSVAALGRLRLPRFEDNEATQGDDWTSLSRLAWTYAMALVDNDWRVKVVLASRIRKLIDPAAAFEATRVAAPSRTFPWTDLVLAFVDYVSPPSATGETIVYLQNDEQPFESSAQWKRATDTHRIHLGKDSPKEVVNELRTSAKRRKSSTIRSATIKKRPLTDDPFGPSSKVDDLRLSHRELLRQVSVEKKRSDDFETFLKSTLLDGSANNRDCDSSFNVTDLVSES